MLYTSLYSSKESHVSQTYQSVQEIARGAFFYTITELKQEEMSFHMVMSSLKTLSEELFMAECAVHWPVMTSWNFLYPHVGGEEKQTNQRGGPQRNIRKLVVSLLLITGIRYTKGTKVYNGFLSICGGEKVGAKPLGKKKKLFLFQHTNMKGWSDDGSIPGRKSRTTHVPQLGFCMGAFSVDESFHSVPTNERRQK